MPAILTPDMKAIVEVARLVFAATVTPDGRPNLSPKGTIRAWDDHHLFFLDIASPRTRANLQANSWIELNLVDQTSRRGYRFSGRATLHTGDEVFRRATERVFREEGTNYPVACVVLVKIERAEPLISPGYWHIEDEQAMRAVWKQRRVMLDEAFEAHLLAVGPWREPHKGDE